MLDHDVSLHADNVRVRQMDRNELSDVIATVCSKFAERPRGEVEDVVVGAYRHLARNATVTSHLIPLTLNRSMRLMRLSRNRFREGAPGELPIGADYSTQAHE
ncbi:hypothetical protein [Mycolicibacterium sp. P9-22]|uniref:hypothetical protein n=1 Tax=Mycolicibacterium sp. P9-22 TaxID=2024613 RepID=UPI0011EE38F7|nr:hypothetical protein [Mycolicibacterium sp. P9-22]KAA0118344.1 hypothetical protein CIW51_07565 [Mycolicibacterium sp. P9-22]